ncbi:MAG: DNA replication complex GINS family protein [Candidatus Aenigmarchaeota archaeon]|nr:DNA replication complex GINS family protein [Candidatus Aenigmarchaeota archaeon]
MADLITYETIRAAHRAEKGDQLQKLPAGFFDSVRAWIAHKLSKGDTTALMEVESAKRLLDEIISRRQRKLVLAALHTIRGDVPPHGLDIDEQKVFDHLVLILKGFQKEMREKLLSEDLLARERLEQARGLLEEMKESKVEFVKEAEKPPVEIKQTEPEQPQITNGNGGKRFRVKMDIPRFVWSDMKEYGPWKTGQDIELEEGMGIALEGRKAVEALI